jgi:hypothetical protein
MPDTRTDGGIAGHWRMPTAPLLLTMLITVALMRLIYRF